MKKTSCRGGGFGSSARRVAWARLSFRVIPEKNLRHPE
jgi:hypothetical protein